MSDKTVPQLSFVSSAQLETQAYSKHESALEKFWLEVVHPELAVLASEEGVPYTEMLMGFKALMKQ